MKKILIQSVIVLMLLHFGTYGYNIYIKKIKINKKIRILPGENVNRVLKKSGIRKTFFTREYFKITGIFRKVKSGYYNFDKTYTVNEFFNILKKGHSIQIKVVIPEGFTLKQVKKRLIKNKLITAVEFDKTLKIIKFPYPTPNGNFEGYFFPNTYYFEENSNPKIVINTILNEFLKKFPVKKYGKDKNAFYKKLILASIIEKEAILDKGKPIIASVFYNRLKKHMKLQSDATVNYLYGNKKKKIYYKDLNIRSPYNTYRNYGLPPGPISNPGASSIYASLYPAKTSYYFFVGSEDGTGSLYFNKTYREHINYQKTILPLGRKKKK